MSEKTQSDMWDICKLAVEVARKSAVLRGEDPDEAESREWKAQADFLRAMTNPLNEDNK